jgi:lipoic acid synthetase
MQEFKEDKPDWLRIRPPGSDKYHIVKQALAERGLNTVCASAKCPNTFECWDYGALTFMILGNVCTRACRFCAVAHNRSGESVDPAEPGKIADAAKALGLNYVVITSVDRDDLDDQGAGHYAACIRAIKDHVPGAKVEVIIPDFSGRADLLLKVVNAGPDVIAHNMETVERLTSIARDRRAGYYRSLEVLRNVKRIEPSIMTKSSVMLGLGEEEEEVKEVIKRLHEARVDMLAIGQYLRPNTSSLPVSSYVKPDKFAQFREYAESLGFSSVISGPFVRTSYRAQEYFLRGRMA